MAIAIGIDVAHDDEPICLDFDDAVLDVVHDDEPICLEVEL